MAWFSRKVRAVRQGSVFVAPATDRRQVTLMQIEVRVRLLASAPLPVAAVLPFASSQVERLGDADDGVNVLVIPVPRFGFLALLCRSPRRSPPSRSLQLGLSSAHHSRRRGLRERL